MITLDRRLSELKQVAVATATKPASKSRWIWLEWLGVLLCAAGWIWFGAWVVRYLM